MGKGPIPTPANDTGTPDGWLSGPAKCRECGHEWVSARPVDVHVFECPACGFSKGAHLG